MVILVFCECGPRVFFEGFHCISSLCRIGLGFVGIIERVDLGSAVSPWFEGVSSAWKRFCRIR